MILKKEKKYIILLIIMLIIWVGYYIQAFRLFVEVKDFATVDASYIIRLLEFTNFRGEQLSLLLIEYFILVSISNILCLYFYKKITYNKKKSLWGILAINIIINVILLMISNIFWVVYVVLALLSFFIISASVHVSKLFLEKTTKFSNGDTIMYSQGFKTEKIAKSRLSEQLMKMDSEGISKLSSEVFKVDDEYYFEIYANDEIILDNEGEFIVNEKN